MTVVTLDVSAVPINPAGAGRYVVELASGLSDKYRSDLVLIARTDDEQRWSHIAPCASVRALAPSRRPLRLLWEQLKLPKVLRSIAPDVHIGPHYTIPERADVPKIATIHDMTFFDNPEWHERMKVPVFRRAITKATQDATALVAVSHDTAQRLEDRFGKLDVTAIPLGVDHERFNPVTTDDATLLLSHGIDGDFVAFVGTIEPRKNVPALLRAFDGLADTNPKMKLVVVGREGWHFDQYRDAVARMSHSDRVVRPGYLPDEVIPALLRQARAVAYPSLAEGFGLPALEALACGSALVTTTGSAMEEVVGDAALLVDPQDDAALRDALQVLIAGGAAVDAMRVSGPVVARSFTWTKTVDAHIALIERVRR